MASFNKVILIGNLTADVELKHTASGVPVCSFTIAVNRPFVKAGEQKCDFFTIQTWRHQAEFVTKFFTKGKPILVCGHLQTRNWTDKEGHKRTSMEIVADELQFVGHNEATEDKPKPAQPNMPSDYANAPSVIPGVNAKGGKQMQFSTPVSQQFEEMPNDEGLPF